MKRQTSPTIPRGPEPSTIPGELKALRQWVAWREEPRANGTMAKVPVNTKTGGKASTTDPSTWGTFEKALDHYREFKDSGCCGVGFVITKDDPFTGIDLDDCRHPESGRIDPWALEVVNYIDSYTEVSPSGTGLRIFVRGVLPPGLRKKGQVEMYDRSQYFTVTGAVLPGVSQAIKSRQSELEAIHDRYLGNVTIGSQASGQQEQPTQQELKSLLQELMQAELTSADREILRRLRAGHYGEQYLLLTLSHWRKAGYRSQSEADLAMFNKLARLTNGSHARMFAIFRATGLMRRKVEDHPSYLLRTIQKAVEGLGWRPAHQTTAGKGA